MAQMKHSCLHRIFFTLILFISFFSCDKNNDFVNSKGDVELFLIKEFEKSSPMFQIDQSTVVTEPIPLLHYEDFLSYDNSSFKFEISENGQLKVKNLNHSVHGIAFALKANNELIYTGYFWPSYSSMSCDWYIIDPISIEYNGTCSVMPGYAWTLDFTAIPDMRNEPRILDIFRRDHKLIE